MTTATPGSPSLLLVDNDQPTVDVFTRAIAALGIHVVSVLDGRQALAASHRTVFNLVLLDLRLPDLHGLDLVLQMRAEGFKTPFIVVSASATAQTGFEAAKLGAWAILEKPVRLDQLVRTVDSAVASTALDRLLVADPRTPCDRLCNFMVSLITSEHDLKTDGPWARHVGVSLSALRDCCKRLEVGVENARNFGRALRAIYHSGEHWTPETVLDIDDRRTLRRFEERSGIDRPLNAGRGDIDTPTVAEFFEQQTWLPRDNPMVLALQQRLMSPAVFQPATSAP